MRVIEVLLTIAAIISVVIVLIVGGIALTALSAVYGTVLVTSEDPFKVSGFISSHSVLFIILLILIAIVGFFIWDYISCICVNVFLALVSYAYFPNKLVILLLIGSAVLYGFVSKDFFTYRYAFSTKNYAGMSSHVIRSGLYAELLTLIFCAASNYVERFLMPHTDYLDHAPVLLIIFVFLIPMIVFLLLSRFQKMFSKIDIRAAIDPNQSMGIRVLYYLFALARIAALVVIIYEIIKGNGSITNSKYFYASIVICILMIVSAVNAFKDVVTGKIYLNSWDE